MNNSLDVNPPVAPALFIGKWTIKILFLLKQRPYRHAQLRHRLGNDHTAFDQAMNRIIDALKVRSPAH